MKRKVVNVSYAKLPLMEYESSVDTDSEEEALAILRLHTPLTTQLSPTATQMRSDDSDSEDEAKRSRLKCKICDSYAFKIFSSKDLMRHTLEHHPNTCVGCYEVFLDPHSLLQHIECFQHEPPVCRNCYRIFSSAEAQTSHKCKRFKQNAWTESESEVGQRSTKKHCPPKKLRLGRANSCQEQHVKVENYRFACAFCPFQALTSYGFLLHMASEHPEPGARFVIKCEACEVGFGQFYTFHAHVVKGHASHKAFVERALVKMRAALPRKSYRCEECPRRFQAHWAFLRHVRAAHRECLLQKCDQCSFRCFDAGDLRVHLAKKHFCNSPFRCPKCRETKESVRELAEHLRSEHSIPLMPFAHCLRHNVDFNSLTEWSNHYALKHKGTWQKYLCEICDKNFKNNYSLKRHQAVHLPTKNFQCSECNKSYCSAVTLRAHSMQHTDRFRCDSCGKRFCGPQQLERHAVVHTGAKPFRCEACGVGFSQKDTRARHVRKCHSEGISSTKEDEEEDDSDEDSKDDEEEEEHVKSYENNE